MRVTNKVVLASTNLHKYEEFTALLAGYPEIKLVLAGSMVKNADKIGYVERHGSYLENALAKARLTNMATHYPALADDSGLEVMALEGRPGVHSHRFAPKREGVSQHQANIDYLLSQLKPDAPMQARFVCTLALVVEGIELNATGVLDGTLIRTPRGTMGFGYDPIFVPQGSNKTLAEMTDGEKNAISHRAKALHALMNVIKTNHVVLAKP